CLVRELLFDKTLQAGETWVFEEELVDRTGGIWYEHDHGFPEPCEQYLLEVRFDPGALPVDCYAFARPGLFEERLRTTDLTLSNYHMVPLLVWGVTAGMVGIGWNWPESEG